MILRAMPLAVCLFWLAYESRFSPDFFASTIETSLVSIFGGIDDMLAGDYPRVLRTASAVSEPL